MSLPGSSSAAVVPRVADFDGAFDEQQPGQAGTLHVDMHRQAAAVGVPSSNRSLDHLTEDVLHFVERKGP